MDSLFCKAAVHGITSKISFGGGLDVRTVPAQISALGRGANATGVSAETAPSSSSSSSRYSFTYPLRSLWPGNGKRNDETALEDEALFVEGKEESEENAPLGAEGRGGNWVLKILHVGSLWAEKGKNPNSSKEDGKEEEAVTASDDSDRCSCCEEEESDGCGVGEKDVEFDRDSFSRLLKRVSLVDAKRYAQMSYLGNIAYCIEKIKPGNLLKYHGLRFITSSVEKKAKPMNTEKENTSARIPETEIVAEDSDKQRNNGYWISASAAYHIAASAASYLQSQTRSILPFKSARSRTEDLLGGRERNVNSEIMSSEVASFVATTNSMTSVVAAKEEMKEAVAKDLNSAHSSPCEWFICDDESSGTRFFVIQGSESLTSWQANLLFEPIEFEGLDVLVHRGIYEAAKGMYRQMLPEIRDHLKSRGSSATLCFTGHSLGGSLSLLVNLMLLMRGEAPLSSLLPVVTFGAPSIMCGGDYLLRKLGLPRNHVQAIIMHRDIVPRAFSCSYPDHVAELLKAINGNFRNHPCLNNQKLLYAPMGELLILQPDEKFSPHHHLLPSGSGLYLMGRPASDSGDSERQLQAAQSVFLNSPHPLEILSDPSAYGSGGAIYRDHDMNSYLRSVRSVIRQELKRIRKAKREHRRLAWWHLVASQGIHASAVLGRRSVELSNVVQHRVGFSRLFRSGGESLKRFSTLVASQHVHMFLVLLLPVRFLLLKMYGVVSLGR